MGKFYHIKNILRLTQSVALRDKVFEFPDNIQKEEVEKVNTRETRNTKRTSQEATDKFACEVCGQVSIQTENTHLTTTWRPNMTCCLNLNSLSPAHRHVKVLR